MRRFLRIFGVLIFLLGIGILALRGAIGISFVLGEKNFYPPAGQFLAPDKKSVQFAVLSDTGSQNWTLERLILEIKDNNRPDFMLHLGDLIVYRNIEHLYWMLDGLDDKLGDVPLYLIAGNHDVKKKKGVDKTIYQRVLGPLYYWFGYGSTLFIGLDSSTEEIDEDQWAFFEQLMINVRPRFKYVVLFTHVPPVVPPEYHHHVLKEQSSARMKQMLKKYPVDLILSGHVHYYSEQNFEGIPVYTVPPSGQYFAGPVRKYGYLIVNIDDKNGVQVQNVYSDRGKGATLWELLFVDLILTNKVRWIAGSLCFAGFMLWLVSHKRRRKQHFHRK